MIWYLITLIGTQSIYQLFENDHSSWVNQKVYGLLLWYLYNYTTYNWKTIEKTDKPESDTDS